MQKELDDQQAKWETQRKKVGGLEDQLSKLQNELKAIGTRTD
jgi:polyhydroxyalkanoate synthesis regulator phasin